ncbi:MAG TPA: DUF2996 domain-containing protein [Synechococcales cyanobacterium M55_K2018_004]|nr:DUF2996 domain-containing protein [Synechococcales cyanobacterium M55_K2018_004]
MAEETTTPTPETSAEDKKAKAATADKPKKEKAPALEDKPFAEFITEHYLPTIQQTLAKVGVADLDIQLVKQPLPIQGAEGMGECWQVVGRFQNGQKLFGIGFSKEDINSPKFFYCADNGSQPSLLESFMIDERKSTLDLLVLYTVQRLNGQKWLAKN